MLISINEKKQAFCRFTFLLSQKAHSKTLVFSYFLNTQSPLAWGRGLKLLLLCGKCKGHRWGRPSRGGVD